MSAAWAVGGPPVGRCSRRSRARAAAAGGRGPADPPASGRRVAARRRAPRGPPRTGTMR